MTAQHAAPRNPTILTSTDRLQTGPDLQVTADGLLGPNALRASRTLGNASIPLSVETPLRHENAGQAPLPTESSNVTHSTCHGIRRLLNGAHRPNSARFPTEISARLSRRHYRPYIEHRLSTRLNALALYPPNRAAQTGSRLRNEGSTPAQPTDKLSSKNAYAQCRPADWTSNIQE